RQSPRLRFLQWFSCLPLFVTLENELSIHRLADAKAVLAELAESVTSVEALRAEVLRPHADVQRIMLLLFQPRQPGIHQPPAKAQVLVFLPDIQHLDL